MPTTTTTAAATAWQLVTFVAIFFWQALKSTQLKWFFERAFFMASMECVCVCAQICSLFIYKCVSHEQSNNKNMHIFLISFSCMWFFFFTLFFYVLRIVVKRYMILARVNVNACIWMLCTLNKQPSLHW